ncbi:hypothetical protein ZWY2020_041409 [Hordeum vulgare]|nr:hypothetical protein ZWY2020_041409 [Hordeum vulgare]
MYSRWRLLSLLRNARLAPAGRLAAAPSLRSFGPPHAAATSGSSDGHFSSVVLGLSSNFVLAQDDLVAPVQQLQVSWIDVSRRRKRTSERLRRLRSSTQYPSTFRDKGDKRINQEVIQKAKGDEKPKVNICSSSVFLDDPELDSMLKNRLRWGDPMAHVVKVVPQNVSPHSWLEHGVDPPPNRYDIKPGHPWDGVDHSNEYKKDMYKLKNDNQATEQDAYVWSVADM